MNCENFKNGLYLRRKKLAKTFSWRAIATTTTFCVALLVTGDASKSGAVAAVDTVLKTFFYYFHETCYDKATKKQWFICKDDIEDDIEMSNIAHEDNADNADNVTEDNATEDNADKDNADNAIEDTICDLNYCVSQV